MERLHRLLFELSGLERLEIMHLLDKDELKLSQISKRLNITVTETSRHLQRLSDASLVEKNPDGRYRASSFGSLALFLLESLDFASKYKRYFLEYDSSVLPYQFVDRLGELSDGTYSADAIKNLEEGERMVKKAEEFVWILSNQVLSSTVEPLAEKLKNRFDLRVILPEGRFPPESSSKLPVNNPGIHKRVLPKVDVLVVLTEKFGIFCLPNKSGRIDYTGFSGESARFRVWCRDLFLCFWDKAVPVQGACT